ncbi:hypothetical protein ACT691_08590 [Vibrio metschnikovii]
MAGEADQHSIDVVDMVDWPVSQRNKRTIIVQAWLIPFVIILIDSTHLLARVIMNKFDIHQAYLCFYTESIAY